MAQSTGKMKEGRNKRKERNKERKTKFVGWLVA